MQGDNTILKDALQEMITIEKIKKLELEAKSDPRKKLAWLMYKAKHKMEQESKIESSISFKRQEFVMVYVLRKQS